MVVKAQTDTEEPNRQVEYVPTVRCDRCEGRLFAQVSMNRGMGPGCWHKVRGETHYARLEAQGQMSMFEKGSG